MSSDTDSTPREDSAGAGLQLKSEKSWNKRYSGMRRPWGADVVVLLADGSRYSLKHHPLHSPTGFEWGYGGSGPADLSFAILADHLGDLKEANEIHQSFKWQVVSLLPESLWVLHDYEVQEAIEAIRRENA